MIFCRLGFSRFGLVELVGRFSFIGLIEKIWLIIYLVYIKHFDLVKSPKYKFVLVDLVWYIWFGKPKLAGWSHNKDNVNHELGNRLGLVHKLQIWFSRFGLMN